jgi:Tol biopolymer transport system component
MSINAGRLAIYGFKASSPVELFGEAAMFSEPSIDDKAIISDKYKGAASIFLFDLKRNIAVNLLTSAGEKQYSAPVLAKDGKKFTTINQDANLEIHSLLNNEAHTLTNKLLKKTLGAFSPDSKYIVYFSESNNGFSIEAVSSESPYSLKSKKEFKGKLNIVSDYFRPVWFADNSNIVFCYTDENNNNQLAAYNIQANSLYLKQFDYNIYSPAPTPDGSRILLCLDKGKIIEINIISGEIKEFYKFSPDEICDYLKFDKKGENVIFSKYNIFVPENYKGSLYILNLSTMKIKYVFSSVGEAFWY